MGRKQPECQSEARGLEQKALLGDEGGRHEARDRRVISILLGFALRVCRGIEGD